MKKTTTSCFLNLCKH